MKLKRHNVCFESWQIERVYSLSGEWIKYEKVSLPK